MKIAAMHCLAVALVLWNCSGKWVDGRIEDPIQPEVTGGAKAPDVPYLPTPMNAVAQMLDMAEVTREDVIYDLGCGDGRIVITAAKERQARGVGIDISPDRIRESRINAQHAGVADRVRFLEQDLFTSDFSDASVVAIYLTPALNIRLRPKILNELKPGTRIVSHKFGMGEWKPDQSASVEGRDIYFWIVPANVSGTWEWTAAGLEGKGSHRLELTQTFQKVEGILVAQSESNPITETRLVGDRLQFTVPRKVDGRYMPVRYEGRVQGDSMAVRRIAVAVENGPASWQARRNPATMTPWTAR
ncbi:MAG: methyltransferase domain-containing protein [Desulfobacteraceae bacterium]|nr:MAG: methyltransferase domain-containing protein [Desulfobacteraceae bacterium]